MFNCVNIYTNMLYVYLEKRATAWLFDVHLCRWLRVLLVTTHMLRLSFACVRRVRTLIVCCVFFRRICVLIPKNYIYLFGMWYTHLLNKLTYFVCAVSCVATRPQRYSRYYLSSSFAAEIVQQQCPMTLPSGFSLQTLRPMVSSMTC